MLVHRLAKRSGGFYDYPFREALPDGFDVLASPTAQTAGDLLLPQQWVKELIKAASKTRGILITDHQYRHVIELANPLYLMHSGTTTVVEDLEDLVRLGYVRGG